jgi:hypothetical protein
MWKWVVALGAMTGLIGCTLMSGADDLSVGNVSSNQVSAQETTPSKDKPKTPSKTAKTDDTDVGTSGGKTSSGGNDGTSSSGGTGSSSSGEPVSDNRVECGDTTCHGPKAACCVGSQGSTKECFELGGACGGAIIECGGRENCGGGQVCCLRLTNGGSPPHASCTAEDTCAGGEQFVFCRGDEDCPKGKVCAPTTGAFSDHKGCI